MEIDFWYIIPASCLTLSFSIACCLFCSNAAASRYQKNINIDNNHELPLYINERTILLENNNNPPPYKERENINID